MTKIKLVETHLLRGRKVTKKHAVNFFSSYNLGDIILKLRKKYGHDKIKTTMISKVNASGEKVRHAEYKMVI